MVSYSSTQNGLSPCALTHCYGLVHVSVVLHRVLTSSQEPLGQLWPNLVCSICRVRRQESVNFIAPTPGGGNLGVKKCKIDVFLQNLLLYSQALIRETKYVVMMTKEGSTKTENFMNPGAGVLMLRRGHISQRVKMHSFIKIFFSTPRHRTDKLSM